MASLPDLPVGLRSWLNGERLAAPLSLGGRVLRLGDFLGLLRGILAPGVEPVSLYVGDGKVLGFGNDLDLLLAHSGVDVLLHNSAGAGRFLAADDTFRIVSAANTTRRAAFDASAITPGVTRTITLPNANVNLGDLATLGSSVAGLTSDLAELETGLDDLSDDLDTLSGTVTTLSGYVTTLQGQMTTAQGNITTLQGQVSGLTSERADEVFPVTSFNFYGVTGAWARTRQNPGIYRLRRTAGAATDTVAIEIPLAQWRTTANKGWMLRAIRLQYQISVVDVVDVQASIVKTTFPANGNAVANAVSLGSVTYDGNHDSAAKRKTVGQHSMTVTLDTPAYLTDGWLSVEITVNATGQGTAQFDQFLLALLMSETL